MSSEANNSGDGHPAVSRPRRALAVMLVGLLSPALLALDVICGPYSSVQTRWSELLDRGAYRRASKIDGPKVMIVGGSNVVFGFRAPDLERELGVPVMLYGVNAGIGLDLIALRATSLIRTGDIVVVAPELQHFLPQGPIDRALRRDWLGLHGLLDLDDPLNRYPTRQWVAIRARSRTIVMRSEGGWANGMIRARKLWRNPNLEDKPETPYDLRCIDEDGNLVFRRPARIGPIGGSPLLLQQQYDLADSCGVRGLRALADACRDRGATLLVMPAVRVTGFLEGKPAHQKMVRDREADILALAAKLGAEALLGPGETMLDMDCGFDTLYHMNDRGVAEIQAKIVPALRPYADAMRR